MSGEWDGLRAAAEAALAWNGGYGWTYVPGVIHVTAPGVMSTDPDLDAEECRDLLTVVEGTWEQDARFIAAADPVVVLGLLDRLATAEDALRRICSDEVWNGADDPEDAMHQIAMEALRPLVAAEAIRDALAAPLSASGAESDHGGRGDGEGLG